MIKIAKKHKIKIMGNSNSNILFPVLFHNIDFIVKNFFIINANQGQIRGNHAHKKGRQIIILIQGGVQVDLEKNNLKQRIIYTDLKKFLEIPKMTWLKIRFLEKSSLFCFSTERYFEDEYIREYLTFKKISS